MTLFGGLVIVFPPTFTSESTLAGLELLALKCKGLIHMLTTVRSYPYIRVCVYMNTYVRVVRTRMYISINLLKSALLFCHHLQIGTDFQA